MVRIATDGHDPGDGLTPMQRKVLEAMRQRGNGEDATLTDVANELQRNHARIHRILLALRRKGYAMKVRYDGSYRGRWRVR